MLSYLAKRLLHLIPTLFIAITLLFIMTRLIPGDPAWVLAGAEMATAESVEAIRERLGIDKPIIIQYLEWLRGLTRGDFGTSFFLNEPVNRLVFSRLVITLSLVGLSLLFTLMLAIPLGVTAANRQNTTVDVGIMSFATIGVSIPSFWLGFVFMLVLGVTWHILPTSGYRPLREYGLLEWLRYLLLPASALSVAQIALLTRTVRTSVLEVLRQEYIGTARAKGLGNFEVLYKHALRNALIPIVTVVGLVFALSVGGALIIETVFAVPGLGRLTILAAVRRDYPLLQGSVFAILLVVIVVNIIVDTAYAFLNPRVKYQ